MRISDWSSDVCSSDLAAHEAFEEAGVTGIPCPTALGEYRYAKRRRAGTTQHMNVALFPLLFREQADEWPEQAERETCWFPLADAAEAGVPGSALGRERW